MYLLHPPTTTGRLYSQCGLIHSSLHQFNEALQSFERALPLVRATGSSGNSSQFLEASLLQNIGATYNERQMFSESLVYHREAATMHGITTHTLIHSLTHSLTHTCTHTNTLTHTCTHTNTLTHTCTHTNTQLCMLPFLESETSRKTLL